MVPAGDQQELGRRRGVGEDGAIGRAWDHVALTVDHPQRLSDLAGYVGDVDLTGELLGGPLAAGPLGQCLGDEWRQLRPVHGTDAADGRDGTWRELVRA